LRPVSGPLARRLLSISEIRGCRTRR
jgi:hypothetical protein